MWKICGWEGYTWQLALFLVFIVSLPVWSFLFFQFQLYGVAALYIFLVNWILVVAVTIVFFLIDIWAGVFMLPGAAWITFASILNLSIFLLNRGTVAASAIRPTYVVQPVGGRMLERGDDVHLE